MTSLALRPAAPPRPTRHRSVFTLGAFEAVRLLRHPLHLLGYLLSALMLVASFGFQEREVFVALTLASVTYHGVLTFFAANLCASRERRSDTCELARATPLPPHQRTAALCLATLAPFALATATVLAAAAVYAAWAPHAGVLPGAARMVGGTATVLGAGLLGVMVARWAPWPGAAAVAMVAVVAATIKLGSGATILLPPYVEWARWSDSGDAGTWAGIVPGSPGWHVMYILALSAMAAAGAMAAHRCVRRPALAAGAAATALAVLTGWAQLP